MVFCRLVSKEAFDELCYDMSSDTCNSCRKGHHFCDADVVKCWSDPHEGWYAVGVAARCQRCSNWNQACSRAPRATGRAGKSCLFKGYWVRWLILTLIVELRPVRVSLAQVEELLTSPPASPTWTEILAETSSSRASTPVAEPDATMAAEPVQPGPQLDGQLRESVLLLLSALDSFQQALCAAISGLQSDA